MANIKPIIIDSLQAPYARAKNLGGMQDLRPIKAMVFAWFQAWGPLNARGPRPVPSGPIG